MADEAKLHGPTRSTFEALVAQYVVKHCHREELGPICCPMMAVGIAIFLCISSICCAYFSDVMASLGFRKL